MSTAVLNRRGRKRRSSARRLPSGKTCEAPVDVIRSVALAQPHRRGLPAKLRLDAKAESVIGLLNLSGGITDEQYQAGVRYGSVVARYRAVIDSWDPNRQRHPGTGRVIDPDEAVKRTAAYNDCHRMLMDVGREPLMAVKTAAILNNWIPASEIIHLRAGLNALVEYFGLTGNRKSHNRINRS